MTSDVEVIVLLQLLRKNPNVRLGGGDKGVSAIKKHRFFRKIDWQALERRELEPPIIPIIVSFFAAASHSLDQFFGVRKSET